ncbi:glyoxalase [Pseudomonas alkylphenolica]|uniref:Glyoxalase n=1 Tax=Pseudomonas alkylphenolica TaxID=237609 RepID=A0A443ZRQ0_9PSED|nr:VOC family protein [Pseudomonas alkylphenolica]RWU22107.1 glyoxalase [Pseudomonas alkylphenolica]
MIAVRDIAYVRYQVPDIAVQARFLEDFGLRVHRQSSTALSMATCSGGYPAYLASEGPAMALGVGFVVDRLADLQRIAEQHGTTVRFNDELGAGSVVSLRDPDGFQIDLLFRGNVIEPVPVRPALTLNSAGNRRRVGRSNRVNAKASQVMRLGHVVLKTVNFAAMLAFYQDVLGFRISDSYHGETPDQTVAAFLHCGLGAHYTDHHTVALLGLGDTQPAFDHSAFEVLDWDDLAYGNHYLAERGHRHSWGIGRHVHGSQVFDYWRDPFGNKVEHWTDGDLVNDQTPVSHSPLTPTALAQWAPPLAPDFLS